MHNRYLMAAALSCCLLVAAPEGRCAGIYKWVDEQGGTHYTVTPPPPGVPAQEIKALPGRKTGSEKRPASAQTPAEPAKPAAESGSQPPEASKQPDDKKRAADQKAIRDQVCQELKANQNTLQTKTRIYERSPQGEVTWLTEEQRQQRIADIQKQLKDFCQ